MKILLNNEGIYFEQLKPVRKMLFSELALMLNRSKHLHLSTNYQ